MTFRADKPVPLDRQVSSGLSQVRLGLSSSLRQWGVTSDDLVVRNLKEFLLANEFGVPKSINEVWPRVRTNFSYFAGMYTRLHIAEYSTVRYCTVQVIHIIIHNHRYSD
jgi:hypothetical protein